MRKEACSYPESKQVFLGKMEETLPYYLVVHEEPSVPRETIESRWVKLAEEQRAFWRKTWHNLSIGKRYCWWDALNKEILEQIFQDHEITWDTITKVELTTPAEWCKRED